MWRWLRNSLIVFMLFPPLAWAVEPLLRLRPDLGWDIDQTVDVTSLGDVSGVTVAFTGLTDCGILTTDANGNLECGPAPSGTGDITGVTAGDGMTGGGSSGELTLDVVGGVGITANANDVAFDATEIDAVTWSDAVNASNLWTFDVSGTNTTVTWGNATATLVGTWVADGLTLGANENITLGSQTIDHNGTDFVFNDSINVDASSSTITGTQIHVTSGALAIGGVLYGWPAADGTSGQFLTTDGGTNLTWTTSSGTDSNAPKVYWWPAVALLPLEAADSIPPIAKDAGTSLDQLTVDFDDTTDECRTVSFVVPPDVTGTVTFSALWYSGSATTNEVMWDFRHNDGTANDVDPDTIASTEEGGDDTAPGTAGQISHKTWTATASSMNWVGDDYVLGVICRDADSTGTGTDDFVGDAKLVGFGVEIPRT